MKTRNRKKVNNGCDNYARIMPNHSPLGFNSKPICSFNDEDYGPNSAFEASYRAFYDNNYISEAYYAFLNNIKYLDKL